MYVDSKPTTTFRETSGWTMPSPQAAGTIKRPPVIRTGSSSSSLSEMEKVVPTFQSFIKQTPSVQQKPLPPAPSIPRRASSSSPPRSRTPSVYAARRSSSVYSRSVSQFGSDNSSWRSADFADEPLPPLPTLLPVAYSASTPHLVGQQPIPPLLQARTYSPLIITPSPTASRVSTPSPPPYHKPSILLPSPPVSVQVPQKQLRTVPLEQAKADFHAPGAVHLLPEELRAQTIVKSKSHEVIRVDSTAIVSGSPLPPPTTLVDSQGRRRTLRSPMEQYASEYPFPTMDSETHGSFEPPSRPVNEPDRHVTQMDLQQQRKASRDKATQALGIDDMDEQRGRTRYRGPRDMDFSHYFPDKGTGEDQSSSDKETDAQNIAKEYHSLLTDQYRSPTSSPGYYHATDSDESIKNHMKMVPRPLFQTKPPAKLPGSVTGQRKDSYISPYRLSDGSENFGIGRQDSSDSSRGPNPFERSLTSESTHKRRSTSGSIPISPPTDMPSPRTTPVPRGRPVVRQDKTSKPRRGSYDNRVSAYYPHIAPRKGRKARTRPSRTGTQSPPVPLLSTDIIAQRLNTPDESPISSQGYKSQSSSIGRREKFRKASNASSDGVRPPLRERIVKGAAKYADLLTKPSDLPGQRNYPAMVPATGAPVSPHLLPSPVQSQPPRVHLGWSDNAKTSYDTSRALPPSPKSPHTPQFTHIAAPARPLDERAMGLRESPRRKSSIFGGVFDVWKESKAEKRREELKKIIKVVPQETGGPAAGKRRASTFGWM